MIFWLIEEAKAKIVELRERNHRLSLKFKDKPELLRVGGVDYIRITGNSSDDFIERSDRSLVPRIYAKIWYRKAA